MRVRMESQVFRPVPVGSWDTHLHILEPDAFPYKAGRRYTPASAPLEKLMASTPADRFLIVQASVEDGMVGVIHHLRTAKLRFPDKIFRAEIEIPPNTRISDIELKTLNDLGVRAIRLNPDPVTYAQIWVDDIKDEFARLAQYARRAGWFISALLPLNTWIAIFEWLLAFSDLETVKSIIEHVARIDPKKDASNYPELDQLVHFLSQHPDKFTVKISALNRFLSHVEGSDKEMTTAVLPSPITSVISRLPNQVIWGSDWPHTSHHAANREEVVPNKVVDLSKELSMLAQSLPQETLHKMFVENPSKLFE